MNTTFSLYLSDANNLSKVIIRKQWLPWNGRSATRTNILGPSQYTDDLSRYGNFHYLKTRLVWPSYPYIGKTTSCIYKYKFRNLLAFSNIHTTVVLHQQFSNLTLCTYRRIIDIFPANYQSYIKRAHYSIGTASSVYVKRGFFMYSSQLLISFVSPKFCWPHN